MCFGTRRCFRFLLFPFPFFFCTLIPLFLSPFGIILLIPIIVFLPFLPCIPLIRFFIVPGRISIFDRITENVSITVKGLTIFRIWDDTIRRDKTPNKGIVVSGEYIRSVSSSSSWEVNLWVIELYPRDLACTTSP